MQKSKFTTYLLYAVGEILLVTAGIVIALQINNWNTERILEQQEKYILAGLKKEFVENIQLIEKDRQYNAFHQSRCIEILNIISSGEIGITKTDMDSLMFALYDYVSYDPAIGVLEEIISSGKLSIIDDDTLRFKLTKWSELIANYQEDVELRKEHYYSNLIPIAARAYPLRNSDQYIDYSFWNKKFSRPKIAPSKFAINEDIFFSAEFESLLYYHIVNQDFIILDDLLLQEYLEEMVTLIDSNL